MINKSNCYLNERSSHKNTSNRCPVNSKSIGAPVLNADGKVVGVNAMESKDSVYVATTNGYVDFGQFVQR